MVARPRRETPPRLKGKIQPCLGILRKGDRVQHARHFARKRGVIGLGRRGNVMREARRFCVSRRRTPIDRGCRNIHDMKGRQCRRARAEAADRHRKDHPIADARVFTVAHDGRAVVEKHAKQRDALLALDGQQPRGRGEHQREQPRTFVVHQEASEYGAGLFQSRGCPPKRDARRRAVEKLCMNGENPVEWATTKYFFAGNAHESAPHSGMPPPSYVVSLDRRSRMRRIRAAPLSNISENYRTPCGICLNGSSRAVVT